MASDGELTALRRHRDSGEHDLVDMSWERRFQRTRGGIVQFEAMPPAASQGTKALRERNHITASGIQNGAIFIGRR